MNYINGKPMFDTIRVDLDSWDCSNIYLGKDNVCRCGCAGEYCIPGEDIFRKRYNRFIRECIEGDTPMTISIPESEHGEMLIQFQTGEDRCMTLYFTRKDV